MKAKFLEVKLGEEFTCGGTKYRRIRCGSNTNYAISGLDVIIVDRPQKFKDIPVGTVFRDDHNRGYELRKISRTEAVVLSDIADYGPDQEVNIPI